MTTDTGLGWPADADSSSGPLGWPAQQPGIDRASPAPASGHGRSDGHADQKDVAPTAPVEPPGRDRQPQTTTPTDVIQPPAADAAPPLEEPVEMAEPAEASIADE